MPPPPRQTPSERAQIKHALREERERQRREQVRYELARLEADRRSIHSAHNDLMAVRTRLTESLEHLETQNQRGQTNLGQIYRLKAEREQVQKQMDEYRRQWNGLGEEVEEKNVELYLGESDD